MADSNSNNSLKEIIDQTTAVDTSPEYGVRTLDLGSVFPNPSSSSSSPLASSIQSIPSYTPPAQSGFTPSLAQNPATTPSNTTNNGPTVAAGKVGGVANSVFAAPPINSDSSGAYSGTGSQSTADAFQQAFGGGYDTGTGGTLVSGGFGSQPSGSDFSISA